MTERLVSKLHVALLSYDEREIRVRKNYLEEQNPAICCVCFHSGEELLRELRQQALTEGDPERVQALRRRQQELRPLLQEARELAEHTAHYYDRGYIRREKYRI